MLWKRISIHGRRAKVCWIAASLTLALVLLCGACGGGAELTPLTPKDIAESGTLVLEAPRQTVLDACVLALRKQGYAIE